MIIRDDISHESGTWLNVDFIAAVRGLREGPCTKKFLRITYQKGPARRDAQ